jgi:hypothetical protein
VIIEGETARASADKRDYCGKKCKFSSPNGVESRLFMLNVIGRDFSSRKLHVSWSLIVLLEVLE